MTVAEIHELTKIDEWFLNKLMHILSLERRMQSETLSDALYMEAKQNGFPDAVIKGDDRAFGNQACSGMLPHG